MSEFADPARSAPSAAPVRDLAAKAALRAELLAHRRTLDTAALDLRLLAALDTLLAGTGATTVAAYAPLAREPGGPGLPAALAARVPRVLLPVLRADRDLDWAEYDGPLPPGPGLRSPAGPRLGVAALGTADLVLVPALAVDRRTGVRLGRGGGSYDRALPRTRPRVPVVALLYPGELRDGVPAAPHDRRVDAVLTPDGLVRL